MRSLLTCSLFAAFSLAANAQYAYIEQNLSDRMAEADDDELIPVVLMLEENADLAELKAEMDAAGIPANRRPQAVIALLKSKAEATQPLLVSFVENSGAAFDHLRGFWITNSIGLFAEKALIEMLASRPEVAYISYDAPIVGEVDHLAVKIDPAEVRAEAEGSEVGLTVIGAPEMWAMGYTGLNVLAMTFDTGVWPDHPALTRRFLPNRMPLSKTWFPFDSPVPTDKPSSHGTHVSGTMLGLDTATADTIGAGFKAYLIATDPTVGSGDTPKPLTDVMTGFEWALNPDGDDTTSDDVPAVINNSWGRTPSDANPPCAPFVVATFEAVEAAGIASIFSAGNAGPADSTIGVPNNTNMGLVNSFSVGALNGNVPGPEYPIAEFSSRGPSLCDADGSLLIKPEVSAPGVNVRSAVGNDSYGSFSGTSMASPHVSGAVILLKEAFPALTGEEILLALYHTATDLGAPGEDNTFGAGLINVKAAFDYLAETHDPVPPAQNDFDLEILTVSEPSAPWRCTASGALEVTPAVVVRNPGTNPVTGIAIEYSINGGAVSVYEDPAAAFTPGTDTEVVLPPIEVAGAGVNELHARIIPFENEYDVFNNNGVKRWLQKPAPQENFVAFFEDFESGFDPSLWTVYNADNAITWDTVFVVQADGELGYAARLRFGSYAPAAGQKDLLIGPSVTDPAGSYTLSFDYYYRRRTNNPLNFDTLSVSIGYNCGDDQLELWRKGGEDLYTNDVHWPNAFPESADEWVNVSLSFTPADLEGAFLENGIFPIFTGHNRRGNNLMVDNINLDFTSGTRTAVSEREVRLFPNPARTEVRTEWSGDRVSASMTVFDLRGQVILQKGRVSSGDLTDISSLSKGVYITEIIFDNGERIIRKLVKQ